MSYNFKEKQKQKLIQTEMESCSDIMSHNVQCQNFSLQADQTFSMGQVTQHELDLE